MEELLDYRNQKLWEEIKDNFNISFEISSTNEYSCFSENKDITFFIDYNNLSKCSFTHEMLHVYLRLKDCYISGGLKNIIRENKILSSIFSSDLLDHIGNCLDHIKMFPIYLDLGFDKKEFISDFDTHKLISNELNILRNNFRINNIINPKAVDFYIGKLIAIFADPNDNFDYTNELLALKRIDSDLFDANQKMILHWKEIKIENRQLIEDDYHIVLFEYVQNLENWIKKNNLDKEVIFRTTNISA